jgi:hypothetical protein
MIRVVYKSVACGDMIAVCSDYPVTQVQFMYLE